jgi:membrane protease YdiL (CAAX protease family)
MGFIPINFKPATNVRMTTIPISLSRASPAHRTAWRFAPRIGVGLVVTILAASAATGLVPWNVFLLLAVAPVAEEVVFRGGLHEQLLRRLQAQHATAAFAANALTALAFAAAHLAVHASVMAALTAVPALLIGSVYQQHRRLAPCIALHALFNATWLLWAGAAA